jgi:hypothetical protein
VVRCERFSPKVYEGIGGLQVDIGGNSDVGETLSQRLPGGDDFQITPNNGSFI